MRKVDSFMIYLPVWLQRSFLYITGFILTTGTVMASPDLDVRGMPTVNQWSRYASIELVFEKTRFQYGESIAINFRIKNDGYQIFRIYPSTDGNSGFDIMLLDNQGREVARRADVDRREKLREMGEKDVITLTGKHVKEVILHPGEVYERRLMLDDFFELKPGKKYRVAGYFYPDARYDFFVRSKNTVPITIDSSRMDPYRQMDTADPATESSTSLTAEETVYLFLSAEMRGHWKNYLKYLDLEKYITVYDRFASRFALASPEQRPVILRQFRQYLTGRPADRLVRFKVIETIPEKGPDGRVLADGKTVVRAIGTRESNGYRIRYEYNYTLEKSDPAYPGFWKIVRVDAKILE